MKKNQPFYKGWRAKLLALLSPVPEHKEDYVDKVVYLLRRDFNSEQQNEIILSIGSKLTALRKQDMDRMTLEYQKLSQDTSGLESKLAFG